VNNSGAGERTSTTAVPAVQAKPPQRRWLHLWPWLAAIASGLLLAMSYAPWDNGGVIWFALMPLVAAVWFGKSERPFTLGYVAGVVFFALTFQWLHALGELFKTPALRGLPILLALYLALYPATWCWFLARVLAPDRSLRTFPNSWRNLGLGALAACAWTALEWVRGWMLSGFGWNGLGVALHRDLPMIQIAEFTGVLGLTWLVAFTNVMGVIIVRRILGELGPLFLKRIRWEFSLSISLIVIVFGYGIRVLWSSPPGNARSVRVAVIQPNIPQEDKFDPAAEDAVLVLLERLTGIAAATKPEFIIWPEAAVPRGVYADEHNFEFIQKIVTDLPCPLLVGTLIDTPGDPEPKMYNGAVLFSPGPINEQPPEYRKLHLVPFGEYLPLRPLLGWLLEDLIVGDIDAGTDLSLMSHPAIGNFTTLICFEDTLGNLTRRFGDLPDKRPPGLLINLTNDGWFLKTCAVEQHLANAVFRAVENRRPLLRCGNTGITGLVEPTGKVHRWIAPHQQGFATQAISIHDRPTTFYMRWGDWIAWVSLIPTLATTIRQVIIARSKKQQGP
jgi:apolipoprotein N-acyltransferase